MEFDDFVGGHGPSFKCKLDSVFFREELMGKNFLGRQCRDFIL